MATDFIQGMAVYPGPPISFRMGEAWAERIGSVFRRIENHAFSEGRERARNESLLRSEMMTLGKLTEELLRLDEKKGIKPEPYSLVNKGPCSLFVYSHDPSSKITLSAVLATPGQNVSDCRWYTITFDRDRVTIEQDIDKALRDIASNDMHDLNAVIMGLGMEETLEN